MQLSLAEVPTEYIVITRDEVLKYLLHYNNIQKVAIRAMHYITLYC